MAQPADTGDGDPLAGPCFGFLQSLIGGDAGTQDRRDGAKSIVAGSRATKAAEAMTIGKAAVDAVAGVVLVLAQRFPAGLAIFAIHAGVVQPGDADSVAAF